MGGIRILPSYSYEDYLLWKGRWEIVEGIPYAISPMPSPLHQKMANEIGRKLSELLEKAKCDCTVYQPIDVKVSNKTVVNPDLLIHGKPIKGQCLEEAPSLIVEIISPSSKSHDKVTKFNVYEDFGVKYYILVDPDEKEILTYELVNNSYLTKKDSIYNLTQKCRVELSFDNIFG